MKYKPGFPGATAREVLFADNSQLQMLELSSSICIRVFRLHGVLEQRHTGEEEMQSRSSKGHSANNLFVPGQHTVNFLCLFRIDY